MVRVPVSLLWNDARTSPSKDELFANSKLLTEKDMEKDWTLLAKTKKQELIKLYYSAEERLQITVADLDALVKDIPIRTDTVVEVEKL